MLLPTIKHVKNVMICKICMENLKLYWSLAPKSRCAQSIPSLLSLRLDHHCHHQSHDDPHLTTTTSDDYTWLHSSKWYSIRSPTGDLPSLRLELPTREESASPARYKKKLLWHLYLFFSTFVFTSFVFLFLFWLMNNWLRISDKIQLADKYSSPENNLRAQGPSHRTGIIQTFNIWIKTRTWS